MGALQNFLSSLATGTSCTPSFADGAYVQHVLEAALESDRLKREVELC